FINALNTITSDRAHFKEYIRRFPEGTLEYLEGEHLKKDRYKHLVAALLTFTEVEIEDTYCSKAMEELNLLLIKSKKDVAFGIESSISKFRNERALMFYVFVAKDHPEWLKEGPLGKSLNTYLTNLEWDRFKDPIRSFRFYMMIAYHLDGHDIFGPLRFVIEKKEIGYKHLLASLIKREHQGLYYFEYIEESQPVTSYYSFLLRTGLVKYIKDERKNVYDKEFFEFIDFKTFVDRVASSFAYIPFYFRHLLERDGDSQTLIIFKFKDISLFQYKDKFVDEYFPDFQHVISFEHGYFTLLSRGVDKPPSTLFVDARVKLKRMLHDKFGMDLVIKDAINERSVTIQKLAVDIFNDTSDIQLVQIEPMDHS
ncbi:MAG: hypothetical protein RIE59_28435, partial [Imperialibacter sp.]